MAEPVEQKARGLGWVPKEEFRGSEDKWVDAETFVKRGEEVMPILRATNRRLEGDVEGLKGELASTKAALDEASEAISELKKHNTESARAAMKATKSTLRTQIRAAREAQDWEALETLEEQLDEVKETEREVARTPATTPPASPPPVAPPKVDPDFAAWKAENPWYGVDKRKTAFMHAEAALLREDAANANLKGKAFLEKAAEAAEATVNPRSTSSKVETGTGSGTSSSGRTGSKKGYADLPSDAKAACDSRAEKLVGEKRAFKTKEEWRAHYADQYFAYNE